MVEERRAVSVFGNEMEIFFEGLFDEVDFMFDHVLCSKLSARADIIKYLDEGIFQSGQCLQQGFSFILVKGVQVQFIGSLAIWA